MQVHRQRTRSAKRSILRILTLAITLLLATYFLRRALSTSSTTRCKYAIPTDTIVSKTEGDGRIAQLSLIVLTHARPASLLRLLNSLRDASYDGNNISLHIWIDRTSNNIVDAVTISTASSFSWPHGEHVVHVWDTHVGLWGQWLDSYRPTASTKTPAILLEDDLQVSPQFYKWLAGAQHAYGHRKDVFGYTLQRGTLRANRTGFGRAALHPPLGIFMYRLIGSWGYAPRISAWMEFRQWFHLHSCKLKPYVEGLVPTLWYKKQRRRSMWTMWHIRYAHDHGLFTVYVNLKGERTLAASWREPGLHFRARKGIDNRASARLAGSMDFSLLTNDDVLPPFVERPPMLDWNGLLVNE